MLGEIGSGHNDTRDQALGAKQRGHNWRDGERAGDRMAHDKDAGDGAQDAN